MRISKEDKYKREYKYNNQEEVQLDNKVKYRRLGAQITCKEGNQLFNQSLKEERVFLNLNKINSLLIMTVMMKIINRLNTE